MQLKLVRIIFTTLLALLISVCGSSAGSQSERNTQPMNPPKSYRLLASGDSANGILYVVSVEAPLSPAGTKELVCEVVRQEKPLHYRRLSIDVFVGLNSWVAPVGHGDTETDRKQYEHWIATYTWNVELPESKNRLLLVRDGFVDFDHLRDCKK